MSRGPAWSPEEIAILVAGVRSGQSFDTIALRLPRRNAKGAELKAAQLRRQGVLPPPPRAVPDGPRPARPGTLLHALLTALEQAASRGQAMPHREELAGRIGARDQTHISELLSELVDRRLVVVEHGALGILRLRAADGSWSLAGASYAPREVLQRRCLACRKPFDAQHKHNFVCGGCKATDAWTSSAA
jgi:hypothetical protein